MSDRPWYVGCSCDHNFVQHTSVMLTSLAENGDVPEATILIAAFGLTHEDYGVLLSHSGRLVNRVRIVDVDAEMLGELSGKEWEDHYPPAVLGRLFLPTVIDENGARLLTLDSDMVVNRSVRPLFEMSLDGYLGAIHDTPRDDDLTYFNSGMMIVNVDRFRESKIAERCLEWLANSPSPPRWPDQDALNMIAGTDWHRLDRTWNWAYWGGDGQLTSAHYELANIAHFTGQGKPWSHADHPGRDLYLKYRLSFEDRRRRFKESRKHVDVNFIATAVEFFLGRASVEADILAFNAAESFQVIAAIVQSDEFLSMVETPILTGDNFPSDRFLSDPDYRHRAWAAQRLPLLYQSATIVQDARSWRNLLSMISSDPAFCARTGMARRKTGSP